MKFLIAGGGSIGAYLGVRLALSGKEVVVYARGAQLQAMQQGPIQVQSPEGTIEARVPASGSLEEIGPVDVVLLGVKAHHLTDLVPRLAPVLAPDTSVVSLQNGIPWWYFQKHGGVLDGMRLEPVDPGGVISDALETRRVVGGIIYMSISIVSPGVLRHLGGNRLLLGELDGKRSERCRRIADVMIASGVRCPVTSDIRQEIWVKILGNVAYNPVSALTRATLLQMVSNPGVARLLRSIMTEAEAVAAALGITLPVSIDQRMAGVEKVGSHKTSTLQDLEAGKSMELDAIVGAVLALGDRLGIDMPHTRTVYACAKLLEINNSPAR